MPCLLVLPGKEHAEVERKEKRRGAFVPRWITGAKLTEHWETEPPLGICGPGSGTRALQVVVNCRYSLR
ncbi:unnamed protein product [Gadus morhua 'NCC']